MVGDGYWPPPHLRVFNLTFGMVHEAKAALGKTPTIQEVKNYITGRELKAYDNIHYRVIAFQGEHKVLARRVR